VRPSSLERKLVLGVVALFLLPTIAAGGILLVLYRRDVLETPAALFTAVLVGFVTMMVYLALTARTIGRSLVRTLQEIQLGTELMAGVNPAHRLEVRTGDELQALAEEINRMADRLGEARTGLEDEIARATRELTAERNTLSGVLGALGEGVVVIGPEGRVTLANHAAQRLLGPPGLPLLGRRLSEAVDGEKLAHFLALAARGDAGPQRFSLHAIDGAVAEAALTALSDDAGRAVGFVLVLRDVTDPVRLDDQRRRHLTDDLLELRGRLAAVRSLAESLLDQGDAVRPAARQLLTALHAEALRLSDVVGHMGAPGRLGVARAPGHFERVTVADLAALTLRRLGADGAVAAPSLTADEVDGSSHVRAELSTLSGALAHLARDVLGRRTPGSAARLRSRRRGGTLTLDIGAEGTAREAELEAALATPVPLGVPGSHRVVDVVHRHAGEVWAYAEPGRFGFRMILPEAGADASVQEAAPRAPTRPRFVGAGLASGAGSGTPGIQRPDFYDFSLFEELERHVSEVDRERPLDDLTYVVVDAETTGLDPEGGDEIVSLAGVVVRGGVVRRGQIFDALVNPRRTIPDASVRFHGITDEAVADCPPIDVVLPAFLDFAGGAVLVGHAVWFDLRFLRRPARRLGLEAALLACPVLDAAALSRAVHGPLADHGLDAMAARLGVAVHGRHSALGDALTTAELLVRLLPLLQKRGIATLGQALATGRRARSAPVQDPVTGGGPA
jgi:DNA polymerase-3 subunit epsilon